MTIIERCHGSVLSNFHRTSVTRIRLRTLLAILHILTTVIYITVFFGIFLQPFIFPNFKLFAIAKKEHRERAASPGMRRTINLKNFCGFMDCCLSYMLLSIPTDFYIAFNFVEKSTNTLRLSFIWAFPSITLNYIHIDRSFYGRTTFYAQEE